MIRVMVTEQTYPDEAMTYIESLLDDTTRNSTSYQAIQPLIRACIEDYKVRLSRVAGSGTSVHMRKEFTINKEKVEIALRYPPTRGIIARAIDWLNGRG